MERERREVRERGGGERGESFPRRYLLCTHARHGEVRKNTCHYSQVHALPLIVQMWIYVYIP